MPGGEYINHFNAVRIRATGSGYLRMKLNSLDSVYTQQLVDLPLQVTTERFATQLANFNHQKAQIEIWTDGLDEEFVIRQVMLYSPPLELE